MKKKAAVIITASGFQDEEYVYPLYRLREAEFEVDVATKDANIVFGKYGVPAKATISTIDLDSNKFDMVLLPGGFEAPDRVRLLPEVLKFVREMNEKNKLIAAICHGPWICISAGITKDRNMTAYWSIETDMVNSGANYKHKVPVVIDGNIITSPHYDNNHDFMKAVVAYFD